MDSILTSVKKVCGMTEDYTHFDDDMIMHINMVFMILTQIGIGPEEGFSIKDKFSLWSDFIPEDDLRFEGVKTYVAQKTKIVFDPPTSSSVMQALKDSIAELEWRLNIAAES